MEIRPKCGNGYEIKALLCKMMFKKKNIGWLYVYDGFFRVSFFMERHLSVIADSEYIGIICAEDF